MAASRDRHVHRRLIGVLAALLPRSLRDDWRREWEAELDHHEYELRTWRVVHVERRLLVRSAGAIRDVVWLQRRRLEEEMVQDIRFGLRLLARSPGFAAAALLSLAIGIGASTAVFTLVNAALIRPLPYPDVDRLVAVRTDQSQHFSVPGFVDLAAHAHALDHLAAFETLTFVLGDGRPEQVHGQLVSPEFPDLLGLSGPLRPIAGRAFTADDFMPGRDRVALLSHRLWTRRYGAATDIVGRTISIDATPTTVIGVLPPEFDFFATGELLQPLSLTGARLNERFYRSLEVVGRLKPEATASQAAAQLAAGVETAPGERAPAMRLEFVRDLLVKDFKRTLLTMWAVAALVLLIGGCNFANLLSARTVSRAHELAVRTALGARPGRITRQLAAEAVILGALGGLAGVLFAVLGRDLLVAATSQHFLGASTVPFDWRVLTFVTVVSLTAGLVFGLLPTLGSTVTGVSEPGPLTGAVRSVRGLSRTPHRGVSTLFASAEVGLTLVLLIGASLLIKSMMQLERFEPGYSTAAMTITFQLPSTTYPDDAAVARFVGRFGDALRASADVHSMGATSSLPLAESAFRFRALTIENGPEDPVGPPERLPLGFLAPPPPPGPPPGVAAPRFFQVFSAEVDPGFFEAMGIPLRSGRDFTTGDTSASQPVAIVNQAFADRYWPGVTALGKRIRMNPVDPWITVVAVAGNIRRFARDDEIRSELYRPFSQQGDRRRGDRRPGQTAARIFLTDVSFVVRTAAGPEQLRDRAQQALASIDPGLPIARFSTLQADLEEAVAPRRFLLRLFWTFGAAALVLAALGVYGVTAYLARRRTREMAVRAALGASPNSIARLLIRQGIIIALYGVAGGLGLSAVLSRLMNQFLYDVQPFDGGIYAGAGAMLAAVVLAASYVPARRAARVDPLQALKQE